MDKNINNQINRALDGFKETIWVYLKSANNVGSNFDPYRNTGRVESFQSPIPVKAVVHQISDTGLIAKELGLSTTGAIEIIVDDKDASILENASKIKYNEKMYSTYHKALGSRMMISKRPFGMTKLMCFREGNS